MLFSFWREDLLTEASDQYYVTVLLMISGNRPTNVDTDAGLPATRQKLYFRRRI